ncbi:MAG TPA: Maf family protein [Candidatus Cloacimonadota bacterium]|nr:Maf family protein [Candidatus Cloacimonadota bacterium]
MLHKLLESYNIILASASARRKDLFYMLGIPVSIRVSDVEEPFLDKDPAALAMHHAANKAAGVPDSSARDIIVAADTIVVLDDLMLGKPDSSEQAAQYLRKLSGREHSVITGICLRTETISICDYERSQVRFGALSDIEIQEYVASGEPMDKAGAYGIQGLGSQFIESIDGCYFNVMGFPIRKFYTMIQKMRKNGLL